MFEFTSSLFFWTLLNFIILLVLLNKFALPAFYAMVEESAAKKEAAIRELEKNRKDAALLMAEYQEKLAKIKSEADEILAQARREKDEIKKQEISKLLAEKQQILSGIRGELAHEKKLFVEEMKEHAANLVVITTKKLIQKELSTADHEAMILENVRDFEVLLKS